MEVQNEICQYHMADHGTITDLKESVKTIVDSQMAVKSGLASLTEAFKSMDRLEARLEKMEVERLRQGELRDLEIKELRAFMNRSLGWAAAGILGLGIVLRLVGMI
jgi:hypothetical protein